MSKKFQGSLEPPLGFRKSYTDVGSDASASRSLVAQTSTESCTTGGLVVEEQVADSDVDGTTSPPAVESAPETESDGMATGAEAALNLMIDSTVTLVSNNSGSDTGRDPSLLRSDATPEEVGNHPPDSPMKKTSKKRFESGTTSIPGRHSDSSSLVDSIRNTEDGYEGGCSDSDDECEWLKELDMEKPKVQFIRVKKFSFSILFDFNFCQSTDAAVLAGPQSQRGRCRHLLPLSLRAGKTGRAAPMEANPPRSTGQYIGSG